MGVNFNTLQAARRRKNLTINDVADISGLGRGRVRRQLLGQCKLNQKDAKKMLYCIRNFKPRQRVKHG